MLDMCVHRKGEIDQNLMELRFSNKEDVLDALRDKLNDHKRGEMKPDLVAIGYLVNEISDRSTMLLAPDILFKICANMLIREDENPHIIDEEILVEKLETFKSEIQRGGLHGFFQSVGLLRLIGLSNISTVDLMRFIRKAEQTQENKSRFLRTLDKLLPDGSGTEKNTFSITPQT